MFCPKCGSQVADGATFCSACGRPLDPPEEAQPQQAHPQQAHGPQQFQPQTQPQQVSPSQPQQQPQPKKRRPPVAAIVAIVAVVAVAAVAAVVAFVVLPRVMPRGIWVVAKETTTTEDQDRTSTTTVTHTLDDRGNSTATHTDVKTAFDFTYTTETTYAYDDKGFLKSNNATSTFVFKSDESPDSIKSVTTYQWTIDDGDKPSKFVRTTNYDNEESTLTQSYEYNSDGHISKVVSTEKSVDAQSESVTEYDGRGLEVKTTTKSSNKDSKTKKTVQYNREAVLNYEYDQSNRPIKCTGTTTDMSINKKVEEHVTTYEYDGNGNVSSTKTEGTWYEDEGTQKYTSTCTYEYKHVDNPTPWVTEIARLGPLSFPAT